MYPDGIGAAFCLTEVGAPELTDVLVHDAARCFLILRNDLEVAISPDYAFAHDSMAVRVRGRFAVGIAAVAKSIRKITVAGSAPTSQHRPATGGARGKAV